VRTGIITLFARLYVRAGIITLFARIYVRSGIITVRVNSNNTSPHL
jgi:hypothetical protein